MRLEFYFVLSSVTRKYDLNNDGWNVRFGSKADMCRAKWHVCFTPESRHVQRTRSCLLWAKSGHVRLFDNFVDSTLRRDGHSETQRLGRLEVDHKLVACRTGKSVGFRKRSPI